MMPGAGDDRFFVARSRLCGGCQSGYNSYSEGGPVNVHSRALTAANFLRDRMELKPGYAGQLQLRLRLRLRC